MAALAAETGSPCRVVIFAAAVWTFLLLWQCCWCAVLDEEILTNVSHDNGNSNSVNNSLSSVDLEMLSEETSQSSTIYFNNPHLLKDQKGFPKGGPRTGPMSSNPEVEPIGGIYLRDEAKMIARHLRTISNEELGVTAMQAIFDSLSFAAIAVNEENQVKKMADRLHSKLHKYTMMLQKTKAHIEGLFFWHLKTPLCHTISCCAHWEDRFQYNNHFGSGVLQSRACDVVPPVLPLGAFCPGQNATHIFVENLRDYPTIKWQYFMSGDGLFTQYPAHTLRSNCKDPDEVRHRELYIATVVPQTKYVVVLIDHGKAMSPIQMSLAKAVAKYVIGSLSHQDQVGLIGLSGEPSYPRSDDCLSQRMAFATLEAKLHFTRFIDGLTKSKDATNHSLGFMKAFEMIKNTLNYQNSSNAGSALIVYISRGLLSWLTEARTVLETIADENQSLGDQVTINTFTVIDDSKRLMYEKNFMQDIAHQNFTKYIPNQLFRRVKRGVMTMVNTTHNLGSVIRNPFEILNLPLPNRSHYSLANWDSLGKGLVLSIAQPCTVGNKVIGIVGMDAHLADIAEDVTSYNIAPNSYAFIVDVMGYVVVHPLFSRDSVATEQPMHTGISHLENRVGFLDVWEKMNRLTSGVEVLVISQTNNSRAVLHIKYAWQRVEDTPFIVCIVTKNPDAEVRMLRTNEVATPSDIIYHQLHSQEVKKCRHLGQLATTSVASLFLSASCFYSPFEFLSQEETRRNVQGYMAYISDNTKLIANPGLKSNVRSDVAALFRIAGDWKRQFLESSYSQFIVRRYAATPRGVFQIYPGATVNKAYDPTKRQWFTSALQHPGKVVLSAPYLDAGGAGYIVTVSHTIYEGRSAAMHSTSDAVVAVIGLDFTLGYFHKVLMDTMPVCSQDRITYKPFLCDLSIIAVVQMLHFSNISFVSCFILDDRGYLITHPDLIVPNCKRLVEQQHITHKEPLVANDILNHKGFVRKNLCNSFTDRTVQRYYQFNTSLEGTLTNLVHGEHCAKYQIVAIPGTNSFLGVVNQTCDMVTAFCPCSTVDRLCLNCHRMEQSECECPCECPLEVDLCTGELLGEEDANPSCIQVPDEMYSIPMESLLLDSLEPCVDTKCSARLTESECIGVLGCEWCQLSRDENIPLPHPFCADIKQCFGGVLGACTPYHNEALCSEVLPLGDFLNVKSAPVGPVAGGIMGCFLILALGVYCYRHHVHRLTTHHYVSSVPDTQVRMSQLDEVDDLDHREEQSAVGHANIVLASFENALSMSPYRINTGYRRPAGGDSDHGYSTMTPHEDSEHMPYAEPLLIGKDKYRPGPPQSVTSSSRASSPVPHPLSPPSSYLGPLPVGTGLSPLLIDPPQTTITDTLRPHHMLASVQVHMVDSH